MFDKFNDSVMFSNPCPPGCETCCPLDIQLAYDPVTNILTLTYIYDNATVARTVNLTDLQEPLTIGLAFNPTTNIITLAGTYAGIPFSNTIDITHNHDLELILNGSILELTGEHDNEQVVTSVDLSPIIFSATGPAGPQGPAGNNGAAGPQGIPGPVGPAGLNWQGTWSASSTYVVDDAVAYNGSSYFCINPVGPSISNPATDIANWALLASQGATGPQGPQGLSGPQGSTGPQGPIGLTGLQGPTGPQGPAGSGGGFTHNIGALVFGGIVFYAYRDVFTQQEQYLIYDYTPLPVSTGFSNIQNAQAITNTSDLRKVDFDGLNNTNLIFNQPGCIAGAAYSCQVSNTNGFTDWYLPSIDELNLLYNSRFIISQMLVTIINAQLIKNTGWSSTEISDTNAYFFDFRYGYAVNTNKNSGAFLYPIRRHVI